MSDKRAAKPRNSLGQIEEGQDLRETFDRLWDSLQKSILSPLASDEVTWPYVTQEVLLEYFVALDAASSGVSRDRLSRLLRNGVVPPKAFLPFIARAYELESPIGTKKRGPKHRVTENYRYWLYCKVNQIMANRGFSRSKAVEEFLTELARDGQTLSDKLVLTAFLDFSGRQTSGDATNEP